MDWLWPLYDEHVRRNLGRKTDSFAQSQLQQEFMRSLSVSTATLYVMEPIGDTIRFKGLGRWPLPEVPELIHDPNKFIADRFGGGKFKVNFHEGETFVCTHNFRTFGEDRWRAAEEHVYS